MEADDPEDGRGEGSHLVEGMKMRLIEPMNATPRIVRTQKTMASIFLGVGSSAEAWLFTVGVRSQTAQTILWLLWYIGMATGLMVLAHALPEFCVFACCLALPLPAVAFLLLSVDLVLEVLHHLEFYIVLLLQGVLVTHVLADLTDLTHDGRWDNKCIAVICYIPSIIVMALLDAYPPKYRALFEILFCSGSVIILLIWNAMIMWRHDTWAPVTSQLGDNLTLIFFYARHINVAVSYPSAFVVIASMVHTQHDQINVTQRRCSTTNDIVPAFGRMKQVDSDKRKKVLPPMGSRGSICQEVATLPAIHPKTDPESPRKEENDDS